MDVKTNTELVEGLGRDGFCLVPGVLDQAELDGLAELARRKLDAEPRDHFERFSHHGSLIPVRYDDPELVAVLLSRGVQEAFRDLGMTDPKWINGYVIAKPPRSPGLWWHQDWWAWGTPRTYVVEPTQLFCMLYLHPTTPENGCLRAIPGSHLARHPLHDLPEPHTLEIEGQPADSPSHQSWPGEVDVLAQPGDLVIGDVRVIHSTHPNTTDAWRTAVDLLLVPHFSSLPAEFRAHYTNQFCQPPVGWWEDPDHPLAGTPFGELLPTYDGPDRDRMMDYSRKPAWPNP
ncbi:phytanoyl-CoA dioxygenase family protein [Saccharothrix sp. NRRL B-16314]|uniref:phytanoyl-CoA dioxygenase family protein n=1 Tax=Saccharothrix sp. NRRL B-16314 TaxID=1463825 RepID=UPI00068C58F7|nr:phytanoyl-CoA dioxygenase family protein [Saccharothrix sp. NRRL B-16314]